MSKVLDDLIASLQRSLSVLKSGPEGRAIHLGLHDPDCLPDSALHAKAALAVDLLHETQQLLEPSTLVLADHFLGYVKTKCLVTAVELDIPGVLADGPKTTPQIAAASSARPDRLAQVLRLLVNHGVFAWDPHTGCFSNNRASRLLLRDHWTQWRNWVELYGNQFYDIARGIPASCRAGSARNAAQHEFDVDQDMFTYFKERGWVPQLHRTLSGGAAAQAPGILADYPWAELEGTTFLDVGGGVGGLVALVLRAHPAIRAGILDLPHVIEQASANFHGQDGLYADVGAQVAKEHLVAGDFLQEIPPFEVYTIKWCLHDWDDSKATTVLLNMRKAIIPGPRARVIVFESILADGRIGQLTGYADINMMMTAHSGQERDELRWRSLARQTGWEVRKIYALRNVWPCAIELVPVALPPYTDTAASGEQTTDGGKGEETHIASGSASATTAAIANGGPNGSESDRRSVVPHERFLPPRKGEPIATEAVFLEPWDRASKGNPFIRSSPAVGYERTNIGWVTRPILVRDARPTMSDFSLDANGFAYFTDPTADTISRETWAALRGLDITTDANNSNNSNNDNINTHDGDKNGNDAAQKNAARSREDIIRESYYPHVRAVLRHAIPGAGRVIIFDHTIRRRDPARDRRHNAAGHEQPATMVHCDQSARAAIKRLQQNLPGKDQPPSPPAAEGAGEHADGDGDGDGDGAESLLARHRVLMVNVWRPLFGPVEDWPLGTIDFRSLRADCGEVHDVDLWSGAYENHRQTVTLEHREAHEWWYLHGHDTHEVTLIKIWDSRPGPGAKCEFASLIYLSCRFRTPHSGLVVVKSNSD